MSRLKSRIVGLIEALGPLPVSEYMALCLSDPQDGYYMTRPPFGREGDFTTAPEISQMFGELIGAWIAATWQAIGAPEQTMVVEIGPGRGTLMKDIARTLGKIAPDLGESGGFRLIETSERLAATQAATLGQAARQRFEWHKDIDELPAKPMIIVGNELFDAIPVRQYVKTAGGWRERAVGADGAGNLQFVAGAGSVDASLLPPDAAAAPEGAIVELAPARSALMQKVAERIAGHGGAGLFIDYGHATSAVGDTLQALLKHAYDDPLAHPGEADLTTHVDFAALAQAARHAGLQAHLLAQGDFLLRMGLLERAGKLGANASQEVRDRLTGEVERLAAPDQMGQLFKVLAIMPPGVAAPGFPAAN
ncbi:class I SAM-dependent methyltransferase [Arvimicrobium flavum]|uniref:class I SAM-dependent methyltransferase n=1 Tax=Arvimicrobium flavum TaxID=3393320 RepID=UPI00237AD795|nr:class I SAM-dependent methyltransferase [Mesorhizobium shangrilense]